MRRLTVLLAAFLVGCPGGSASLVAPPPPPPPPPPPAPVASVQVALSANPIIVGATSQATATPRDAQGNTLTGRVAPTWSLLTGQQSASISSSGLLTGLTPGSSQVAATIEGVTGSANLTVNAVPIASVSVSLSTNPIFVGATSQATATPRDALGSPLSGRAAPTWTLFGSPFATVSSSGLVTGVAPGLVSVGAAIEGVAGAANLTVNAAPIAPLEIHQINVGWGSSVFVRGPDGTTILLEAGNTGNGTADVVPYLKGIGLQPASGLAYTIAGHQHCDHLGGLDEVVAAGYNVRTRNYYNGSSTTTSCVTEWLTKAETTTAGAAVVPLPGAVIQLGSGAKLTFVAVNGSIIGGGGVAVSDENDRSIAVLIQYGGFDYLWGSDLGGGQADNACTGRSTDQKDLETPLLLAISPGGASPLLGTAGVDVWYVDHHGSESSTNSAVMNLARPQVAVIGVGSGQSSSFQFPRKSVVEKVLLAQGACVTAPAALVLQSEEGSPAGTETSFAGYSVGDVKISTDGQATFTVSASGRVTEGPVEITAAGLPRSFTFDRAPAISAALRSIIAGARAP